jgi:hypothetical protein
MYNIQTLINEVVEKNNQVKSAKRDGAKFHISDAGSCYRKRYLKRLGVAPTRTIDTPALRKMVAGDAGHEMLQKLLRYNGKLLMSEATVETEHLKGHPDGIIKNGSKALLEIKTIEKWGMGWIKKTGAKPNHKLQMFTYWWLLRRDYKDLDNAVLSYVKREDFEAHDFYFNWSDEIETQVNAEWKPLIDAWVSKKLPDCTCATEFDGSGPKYCMFLTEWDDKTKKGKCCDSKLNI